MQRSTSRRIVVALTLFVAFILIVAFVLKRTQHRFTSENVDRLETMLKSDHGMTRTEVEGIIGPPTVVEPSESGTEAVWRGATTWYEGHEHDLELRMKFDSDGKYIVHATAIVQREPERTLRERFQKWIE